MSRYYSPSYERASCLKMGYSTFCQRCQELGFSFDSVSTRGEDHQQILHYKCKDQLPHLSNLNSSFQRGCKFCGFLAKVIRKHILYSITIVAGFDYVLLDPDSRETEVNLTLTTMQLWKGGDGDDWFPSDMSGQIRVGNIIEPLEIDVKDDERFLGGFPDPDPLSERTLNFVSDKIELCIKDNQMDHGQCSRSRASVAPLRLLAVHKGDFVQLTEADGQHLQYAALSYCWGSSQAIIPARTLASNIEFRLKSGFTLSSLPQTLQDGITVARRLSIPYIWIDALCIVQDSEEEWKREARKMMQYYEHAYITIVATSAASADEGFLHNRPSYVHLALKDAWSGEPGKALHFSYPQYDNTSYNINDSVWNKRGWTFQERLLSARLIFFARHGTWFECRGAEWTDGQSATFTGKLSTRFLSTSTVHSPVDGSTMGKGWTDSSSTWREWYEIIHQYSERKLTNADDSLPAISGISANFSRNLDAGVYLLGLWKGDICRGLLWRRIHDFLRGASVYHYQSGVYPSWTWCSMTRRVFWPPIDSCQNTAQLVNVEHAGESQESSSSTKSTLVMSGHIFNGEALAQAPPKTKIELCFDDDEHQMDIVDRCYGKFDSWKLKAFYAMILVEDKRVSYLSGAGKDRFSQYKAVSKHHGILLEQKSNNSDQFSPVVRRFYRVGVFCVEIFEDNDLNRKFMTQLRHHKDTVEIT